jgi:hypothetical protein
VAACSVLASAVSAPFAFAQAGSTGGSLGQTDKSASGDSAGALRPTKPVKRPAQIKPNPAERPIAVASPIQPKPDYCKGVVGVWKVNHLFASQTTFNADGSGSNTLGGPFTWTCSEGTVVFNWINNLKVSEQAAFSNDGNKLLIRNSFGESFSADHVK